ncbi:AAA family ATPase [Rhodococcus hoagii]|nr:AAA family ATPase [Prescottella equi]NKW57619.1 AAA family ATPase [Prescottella equi]
MPSSMPVVAIANQKGGVGKTAVTLGLASAASAAGIPTLVVDMDPQGNSTTVSASPTPSSQSTTCFTPTSEASLPKRSSRPHGRMCQ